MTLTKNLSLPINLNIFLEINKKISKKCNSFNDFETLILSGQHKVMTFGNYSLKKTSDKIKRRKVIKSFYRKLYSKL